MAAEDMELALGAGRAERSRGGAARERARGGGDLLVGRLREAAHVLERRRRGSTMRVR